MREKLSEIAHDRWSGWMLHLFANGIFNNDGTWTMSALAVERWLRQATTGYTDLSESEKDTDRDEADRVLEIFANKG